MERHCPEPGAEQLQCEGQFGTTAAAFFVNAVSDKNSIGLKLCTNMLFIQSQVTAKALGTIKLCIASKKLSTSLPGGKIPVENVKNHWTLAERGDKERSARNA
jgi:hypothetical protein